MPAGSAHGRLDAGLQALPVGQLVADIEQVGRRMPRLLLPMLPSILQLTGCGDGSLRRQAYKLLKVPPSPRLRRRPRPRH